MDLIYAILITNLILSIMIFGTSMILLYKHFDSGRVEYQSQGYQRVEPPSRSRENYLPVSQKRKPVVMDETKAYQLERAEKAQRKPTMF